MYRRDDRNRAWRVDDGLSGRRIQDVAVTAAVLRIEYRRLVAARRRPHPGRPRRRGSRSARAVDRFDADLPRTAVRRAARARAGRRRNSASTRSVCGPASAASAVNCVLLSDPAEVDLHARLEATITGRSQRTRRHPTSRLTYVDLLAASGRDRCPSNRQTPAQRAGRDVELSVAEGRRAAPRNQSSARSRRRRSTGRPGRGIDRMNDVVCAITAEFRFDAPRLGRDRSRGRERRPCGRPCRHAPRTC